MEVPAEDDWQWPYDPKAVQAWKSKIDSQKVEDHLFDRNIFTFWTKQRDAMDARPVLGYSLQRHRTDR
jgi:hypothetical protein